MKSQFISGSLALAEGAIYSGCRYYFGTPSFLHFEILEYMAKRLPEVNGVFLQAENESSAISMVIGASASGARVLISSNSNGINLMSEGISYLYELKLPCVIANVIGNTNFNYLQIDYKQNIYNDNRLIIFSPNSVQEIFDLTNIAFNLSDKYRTPVMICVDSQILSLMEKIEIDENLLPLGTLPLKEWAVGNNEKINIFNYSKSSDNNNIDLIQNKKDEERYEGQKIEDAEFLIISYGIVSRILYEIIDILRKEKKRFGLFRPITLNPFPHNGLKKFLNKTIKKIFVVELNELNSEYILKEVKQIVANDIPIKTIDKFKDLPQIKEIIEHL